MNRLPAALAIAAATAPGLAQDLDFTVDPGASDVAAFFSITADAAGSLIGDHDATTNPGGTQTRPGLFGGSGNAPIPVDLDLETATTADTNPAGAFSLAIDTDTLTFDVSGLALDLLASGAVGSDINATLEWSAFHTVNPTFIFFGDIPLTLPLASSNLTAFTLVQSGAAPLPGVLTPIDPDTYSMTGFLPVTVSLDSDSALLPVAGATFDAVLPLAGQVALGPDNTATATLFISLDELSQSVDLSAIPPVEDVPLELPTIGADTASVLLTLAFDNAAVSSTGALNIVAEASPAACNAADLAAPLGALDFSDVTAFLTLFSQGQPGADLAPPVGVHDFSDVVAFLSAFGAGCP